MLQKQYHIGGHLIATKNIFQNYTRKTDAQNATQLTDYF